MSRALPLVRLPAQTAIHRFGSPSTATRATALLRFDEGLTIPRDGQQGWAIVGDGEGRRLAVETLLSRHRIQPLPPPPGAFPYINSLSSATTASPGELPTELPKPIRHLAFARPPPSGEFTDFTARYGALQEEDKLSFRQTLSALHPSPSANDIEDVAKVMRIHHLLDLPSVSLSSGQTRRARIAAALLTRPVLLLLEDPMAGLDVGSRAEVAHTLGELNARGDIRIALVLRGKAGADVPEWITNICEVQEGDVWVGTKEAWRQRHRTIGQARIEEHETYLPTMSGSSEPVVALNDVSVSYGEGTRPVLKDISWEIRPGEKWHLQGANGSGKTTLLSLVLGHHPRSFSLPASALTLFSKPRRSTPTPTLRTLIGHTSPEIYASFPRGMGLSALSAVGSGFEGVFSRRNLSQEQKDRVVYLLDYFKDLLSAGRTGVSSSTTNGGKEVTVRDLANRLFAHYTPPQQALLLFLRAIVARCPLVILDEPAQGMDETIWQRCCELLEREWKENPDQAVVVVSHYEDEVPWTRARGRVYRLIDGVGHIDPA